MTSPAASGLTDAEQCAARPLRADARRNRERILKAAEAVFAGAGVDAQIDDVAKRAKVGVGTVYRHFPTKEALLEALVGARFEAIAEMAREGREDPDPWQGFCDTIWRATALNATDRAFCDAVALTDQKQLVESSGLQEHLEALMEGAKAAGKMRADASVEDIGIFMCGAGAVMRTKPSPAWQRYLTVVLDGLRAA